MLIEPSKRLEWTKIPLSLLGKYHLYPMANTTIDPSILDDTYAEKKHIARDVGSKNWCTGSKSLL